MASHWGHPEVVRLLLKTGADTEIKDKVSAFPAVHVGYVAFLNTALPPALPHHLYLIAEWRHAVRLCQGRRHQRGVSAVAC
jgi:hypothetical protein